MKAFLSSLAVAAIISIGAYLVLNDEVQRTAQQAYSTSSTRVGTSH